MSLAELLERAMKLPPPDREVLAHELLASLEGASPAPPAEGETSEAWVKELQARIDRYERGETRGIPWREVMDDLDKELDEAGE